MPYSVAGQGFAAAFRRLVDETKAALDDGYRAAVGDVAAELALRTPVKTGRLVANWDVAVGELAGGGGADRAPDPSREATIARLRAATATLNAGETTFVFNDTPYGSLVEFGSGTRAPRAMVRGTVTAAPAIVARAFDRRR